LIIGKSSSLKALADNQLTDTPPAPAFDDIVMAATPLCEAQAANVSSVNPDRPRFKAKAEVAGVEPMAAADRQS
jgi:hypothetical protein